MEVTNVFENQVTLDWKYPEDDGDAPILHYEIERQDTRDGIWLPAGRSNDTTFVVDGLNKGSFYKFRVKVSLRLKIYFYLKFQYFRLLMKKENQIR